MLSARIIAVTGGIGAGKSVVSAILRHAGYSVYDCDTRAKELMNHSDNIIDALVERFGAAVYDQAGCLNRNRLASIIFNDADALNFVNSVVHPVVRDDIIKWCSLQPQSPGVSCRPARPCARSDRRAHRPRTAASRGKTRASSSS